MLYREINAIFLIMRNANTCLGSMQFCYRLKQVVHVTIIAFKGSKMSDRAPSLFADRWAVRSAYFVCFLLGNSPASGVYMPTFRNTVSSS